MLDAYIIEEIKREEQRRRDEAARPRLRIEVPRETPPREPADDDDRPDEDDEEEDGPTIVKISLA